MVVVLVVLLLLRRARCGSKGHWVCCCCCCAAAAAGIAVLLLLLVLPGLRSLLLLLLPGLRSLLQLRHTALRSACTEEVWPLSRCSRLMRLCGCVPSASFCRCWSALRLASNSLQSCSVIYICRCCLQKLESLDVVGEAFARLDAAIAEERFEGAPALQSRLSGGSCSA